MPMHSHCSANLTVLQHWQDLRTAQTWPNSSGSGCSKREASSAGPARRHTTSARSAAGSSRSCSASLPAAQGAGIVALSTVGHCKHLNSHDPHTTGLG